MYKYTLVKNRTLPGMDRNERYILSLDNHVEMVEAIMAFCRERDIKAGHISGLGATNHATFRYLDPSTLQYVDRTFEEQMEITNITGNISQKDGEPYLHIHLTCSRSDYSCVGGHLLSARISGACELLIDEFCNTAVGREKDPETGLNMYKF